MNEDIVIRVKGLTRTFKVAKREKAGFSSAVKSLFHREYVDVTAVKDVNFTVGRGEIRGLIGPNGAGKSTTIKILSGILYPSSGEVDVMGYRPWLSREQYVRHIGVLFGQKSQLSWDLPAIDSYLLNKKLYGIPDAVYRENIDYFKELLGIADVVNKPVRQLSLGERMKCEFACAMLHNPPLVFLDEPTIGLDILSKEAVRGFISRVNKDRRTTFILTTHDLGDIENLCGNITVINKGRVMYDDTIDRLTRNFSAKKTVGVRFSRRVDAADAAALAPTEFDGMSASFEVDLTKQDLKTVISSVFEALPVADIDVRSVGIEEVVKFLYSGSVAEKSPAP